MQIKKIEMGVGIGSHITIPLHNHPRSIAIIEYHLEKPKALFLLAGHLPGQLRRILPVHVQLPQHLFLLFLLEPVCLEHVSFRRPVQSEFALLRPTEILGNVFGISDVFDHDVGRLGMVQVVILLVCETGDLLFEPESVPVEFRHDILAAVVPAVEKRKVHDDG